MTSFKLWLEGFADDAGAIRSMSKRMEAYWYVIYWDGSWWRKFYDPHKSPTPQVGQVTDSLERACQEHDIVVLLGVRFTGNKDVGLKPLPELKTGIISANDSHIRSTVSRQTWLSALWGETLARLGNNR